VPFKTPSVPSRHDTDKQTCLSLFEASRRRRGFYVRGEAPDEQLSTNASSAANVSSTTIASNASTNNADDEDADDEDDVALLRDANLTVESALELMQTADGDAQRFVDLLEMDQLAGLRAKSRSRRAQKSKDWYKCPHCGRDNHAMSDQRERDMHEQRCKGEVERVVAPQI
jgi:hypothetical protein